MKNFILGSLVCSCLLTVVATLVLAIITPTLAASADPNTQQVSEPNSVRPVQESDSQWGMPVEGLQCRLRPLKSKWQYGQTPTLYLDLKNKGKHEFILGLIEANCEIEVDGDWYGWAEALPADVFVPSLDPGSEKAITIKLTNSWALPKKGKELKVARLIPESWGEYLKLNPGKHIVRARFTPEDPNGSYAKISAVSNPVEVEILPEAKSPMQADTNSVGASAKQTQDVWGTPVYGLRMALFPIRITETSRNEAQFYIALNNTGENDIILNLGTMLANGKVQHPESISLLAVDNQGTKRELPFFDKRYALIAGRIDDFIVPLPAGGIYTLRLSLDRFVCHDTNDLKLPNGKYQIMAVFKGTDVKTHNMDMRGVPLMNFWKGTLTSNTIKFDISIITSGESNSNSVYAEEVALRKTKAFLESNHVDTSRYTAWPEIQKINVQGGI